MLLKIQAAVDSNDFVDEEKDELGRIKEKWNSKKGDLEVKLTQAEIDDDKDDIKTLKRELLKVSKNSKIADKRFEHYEAKHEGNHQLAATIQDEINELLGLTTISTTSTTTSSAVSSYKEGEQQPQKRTSSRT